MTSTSNKTLRTRALVFEYLRWGLPLTYGLILTPLILNNLGKELYGIWIAMNSLIVYINWMDFGVSSAIPRLVSQLRSGEQNTELNTIMSTTAVTYIGLGGLLVLATPVLGRAIVAFFGVPSDAVNEAVLAVSISIISVTISLMSSPFRGLIYGHNRLDIVSVINILALTLTFLATVIGFRFGSGLLVVALASLMGALFSAICFVWFSRRIQSGTFIAISSFRPSALKSVFLFSVPLFVVGLGHTAIFQTDNIVIGRMVGTEFVAAYAIGFQVVAMALELIFRLGGTYLPSFSEHYARADRKSLQTDFLALSRMTMAFAAVLFCVLALTGQKLIGFWIGAENALSLPVFLTLLLLVLIRGVTHPSAVLLPSLRKERELAGIQLAEATINVGLTIVLAKPFGLWGVAFGSVCAQVLTSLWWTPRKALRVLSLPASRYLRLFIAPLCITICSLLSGFLIATIVPNNFVGTLLVALWTGLTYLCLYWLFGTSAVERGIVIGIVLKRSEFHRNT